MHVETLDIGTKENLKKKYGASSEIIPIPDGELSEVKSMNRKERREWASKERRKRKNLK